MVEKFKRWFKTTLKEAVVDNWSELAATLLAGYGTWVTPGNNFIFGFSFFLLLAYWLFWRLLGVSKTFNK